MIVDLWVGDAETGDIGDHMDGTTVDAVYCDPPWNAGIAKIFRNWAGATGDQFSLGELAKRTVRQLQAACPRGPWFLDVGPYPDLWWNAVKVSRPDAVVRSATWSDGKLTHVIQSRASSLMPSGLEGEESTEWVFNYFVDMGVESVLDPFIGKGLTVRHAVPLGISVYGMELNAKRLSVAEALADELMGAI